MPIYEYRCQSCGHEFEAIQKVSETPLTTCPACSLESLRKKISAAGFRLKGGGWYETDFKAGQKKNVAADGAGSKDDSGKGGSGKDSSGSDGAGKPAAAEGGSTSTKSAGGAGSAAAAAAPSGAKSSD